MYDAMVLAGGSGRRLGGIDKASLVVGGSTLLDRVLAACQGAEQRIVVGPPRSTVLPVLWTREDPPGGGPVRALVSGLDLVTAPVVLLVAVDLPHFTTECATALVTTAPAVIVADDRPQWLCGAWPATALRQAIAAAPDETRLGVVLTRLAPKLIEWSGPDQPWDDCDTPADLARFTNAAAAEGV